MPFYDFKCTICGLITEDEYNMLTVPGRVRCPECKGAALKQFPSVIPIYRTSGFYSTDKILSEPENPLDVDD